MDGRCVRRQVDNCIDRFEPVRGPDMEPRLVKEGMAAPEMQVAVFFEVHGGGPPGVPERGIFIKALEPRQGRGHQLAVIHI
jgi:hypothetical protein